MSIEGLVGAVLIAGGLAAVGWIGHTHAVSAARQAGYDAAVEVGRKQHAIDAAAALVTERTQREKNRLKEEADKIKEETYAENLSAAQRRHVSGADRLRCPGAGTVSNAPAASAGPAAGGPASDGPGAAIVPAVAVDVLGLAADTSRLVRKYDRVVERLDACIAVNNGADLPR